jgi:DNA-binding sugar fermentation-stimulating protein
MVKNFRHKQTVDAVDQAARLVSHNKHARRIDMERVFYDNGRLDLALEKSSLNACVTVKGTITMDAAIALLRALPGGGQERE